MAEKQREKTSKKISEKISKVPTWLRKGILVSLAAAVVYTSLYGYFRLRADLLKEEPLESSENIGWLYQNTFVLYRDLYNRMNHLQEDYLDIYVQDIEELSNDERMVLKAIFQNIDEEFSNLNSAYGYIIHDDETGYYVSNMSEEEISHLSNNSYLLISFVFDDAGYVSVGEKIKAQDTATLRKTAMSVAKTTFDFSEFANISIQGPRNCTVTFAVNNGDQESDMMPVTHRVYTQLTGFEYYEYVNIYYYKTYRYGYNHSYRTFYEWDVAARYLLLGFMMVFVLGCFLPINGSRPWLDKKWCSLPLEVLVAIGFGLYSVIYNLTWLVIQVATGQAARSLAALIRHPYPTYINLLKMPVLVFNVLVFTVYFLCIWYLGISARAIRDLKVIGYLRKRSLIWRFFRGIKVKLREGYRSFLHVDLTKNSLRMIRKVVIINALILTLISAMWLGGLGFIIIYSVVLYLLLKRYFGDLQKRYGILLKAVDEMAEGNLNVTIEEDLGVFEPLKPQIFKIQSGFKKAVGEEVKSQRMKAELITNVSHDLKTPLTAIITYVNLLKDPNLTEDQRKEYLDTLERKSLRLKVLIEDLFEVSKANSGNVTLNLMPLDLMNLVKQVSYEMKDKLDQAQLDIRMNLTDEKITLSLDSQKTYRVYENLFSNVAKYALPGTRVYVNGFRIDDTVVITIKNISAQELTVEASELMERFVRGDEARNTEGSGLGLAIAKSFIELQGGRLELEVDGDLFKATTVWKM